MVWYILILDEACIDRVGKVVKRMWKNNSLVRPSSDHNYSELDATLSVVCYFYSAADALVCQARVHEAL